MTASDWITVANKHHSPPSGEYIGRGSPLGNPYSHMAGTKAAFKVATREESIDRYATWLRERIASRDQKVCDELNRLFRIARSGPLTLVCFCAPKPCHGDVIKDVLMAALAEGGRDE